MFSYYINCILFIDENFLLKIFTQFPDMYSFKQSHVFYSQLEAQTKIQNVKIFFFFRISTWFNFKTNLQKNYFVLHTSRNGQVYMFIYVWVKIWTK